MWYAWLLIFLQRMVLPRADPVAFPLTSEYYSAARVVGTRKDINVREHMWHGESSDLLWFVAGLVLMLVELAVPRFIVLFFGLGAWITAVVVALGVVDSLSVQLIIFLVSSIIALLLLKKQAAKHFGKGRA
jgi:hypothetical protein